MTGAPDAATPFQTAGHLVPQAISPGSNRLPATILVALSFLLYAAVRAPVPAVNEPHYLAKAKHYWNPSWCRGDFFLESSNTHLVFYQTFGWPTLWLSLDATAWLGRIAGTIVLAIGWTQLVSLVVPSRWSPLLSAWGFLFLQACGSLSGEWIAGGVESKVPAYGLLFWSLAKLFAGSRNAGAFLMGLSISFHPVVGAWGFIAAAGALAWSRALFRFMPKRESLMRSLAVQWLVPGLILLAAALPGLLPALWVVSSSSFAADYIQVFFRLDHHLDPMQFSLLAATCYVGLFLLWLVGGRGWLLSVHELPFQRFVLATSAIALVGLLAGLRVGLPQEMPYLEWRMKLLKLYPFRLFDTMLPMAVTVTAVGITYGYRNMGAVLTRGSIFGGAMLLALLLPSIDRNASRMEPNALVDWLDACEWISQNTLADAHVFTPPRESWAFQWYAQRAEFVSFKNCPQDADGIVEWNDRLNWIQQWGQRHYDDGKYADDELRELNEQYGITHVLAGRLGPMELEPVYRNGTFRVYSLLADTPEVPQN